MKTIYNRLRAIRDVSSEDFPKGLSLLLVLFFLVFGAASLLLLLWLVSRLNLNLKHLLPPDPIILSMIAAAAPETAVFPVEINGIDRAWCSVFET